MKKLRPLLLLGFLSSFFFGVYAMFALAALPATISVVVSVMASWMCMGMYQSTSEDEVKTSTTENRKLMVVIPLFFFFIAAVFFQSMQSGERIVHGGIWVLMSLMLFFHFDTFNSRLTYFGKRKPIVKNVRFYYQLALFFMHFSLGALIMFVISFLPFSKLNYVASIVYCTFSLFCFCMFALLWRIYRIEHAHKELIAAERHGEDFLGQFRGTILSALPPKKFVE